MQAYGEGFARVYNTRWIAFAKQIAPHIHEFYTTSEIGQADKSLLDLCCGTGQLALHFLENGFNVVGVDLSEHMLRYAGENASSYVASGQAEFIKADASNFALDRRFGLVVSTFDSLNHLESAEALKSCFRCVCALCEGYFVFDLNTRKGLTRWNSMQVSDAGDDALIITRGIYDGQGDRALMRITGFVRLDSGHYERFDETAFNTVYDLAWVKSTLLEVGFSDVHFARVSDLQTPLDDPEAEGRVFIVARK